MRWLGILLVLCSAAAPLSASEYSQQDVAACTPDAWRVCGHEIPDADRVRQCLFDKQKSLNAPCFNVIERARLAARDAERSQRAASGQRTRSTAGQGGSADEGQVWKRNK